jgi:putative tricarboxylic transport membrane protein
MRFNDAITGAVLVIFAIAEIAYTRTFPSLHGQSYGPDLFPMLIGFALVGCGIILILRGLLARRTAATVRAKNPLEPATTKTKSIPDWFDTSTIVQSYYARVNAVLILLFLILYVLLSDWVGFIPLSIAIISILLYRLGSSAWISIVIAIITTGIIQFLFAKVLLVPLPIGLLQGTFLQTLAW